MSVYNLTSHPFYQKPPVVTFAGAPSATVSKADTSEDPADPKVERDGDREADVLVSRALKIGEFEGNHPL